LRYEVLIEKHAQKQLASIPRVQRDRIAAAIRNLAEVPRPSGVRKLSGREAWRIRVGEYRVIYEVHDELLVIVVISLGHRRDIYRG
jgi:mRNA interferase RelE/StbE